MIIINIHSFVDLITNSSTELFVLDTEKSIQTVRSILAEAIYLHNISFNTEYTFGDIFDAPYLASGKDALGEWYDSSDSSFNSKIERGIIIRGRYDNSIPYWMFDFITAVFGWQTERFHLG